MEKETGEKLIKNLYKKAIRRTENNEKAIKEFKEYDTSFFRGCNYAIKDLLKDIIGEIREMEE